VEEIEKALKEHPNIDYYRDVATFTAPYELKVGNERIKAEKIFIGSGSKPLIPNIKGLSQVGFITSDTLLELEEMPESLAIIGGGYIAVEYGNFFARLGCDVKIIEMFPRILYNEEPELSWAVQEELGRIAEIYTSYKVIEVKKENGLKKVVAVDSEGNKKEIESEEVLVAAGRAPNSDILKPENGGIKTDSRGWIVVNEYLETSMPGVYALGDAIGKYMFKHAANHEARVVFENAVMGRRRMMNYDVVPHAAFTQPEIASVGLKEAEAIERYGKDNVLIGYEKYETTGKGLAMNAKGFVKVIVSRAGKILGAHIAGKYASVMIQEIVNLMVAKASVSVMLEAMHIHPALSEAVVWAFGNLMEVEEYHRMLAEFGV
jgi:dihydrolipoamide dehydrogenase